MSKPKLEPGWAMPADFSDVGRAEVFQRYAENRICYSESLGFLAYDRTKWTPNEAAARKLAHRFSNDVLRDSREFFLSVQREAAKLEDGETGSGEDTKEKLERAKQYRAFAKRGRASSTIDNLLKEAKALLHVPIESFDRHPELVNCPSGTYNLSTGKMQPHQPGDYLTQCAALDP